VETPRAQGLWLGRYSGRSFFRPRRLGKLSGHGVRGVLTLSKRAHSGYAIS